MKHSLEIPTVIASDVVSNEFGVLSKDSLILPGKVPYQYYKFDTAPYACMTLPFTKEGKLVLNFEYRHPVGEVLLSCPGGIVEPNEDPAISALRELKEETGFTANKALLLGSSYPFPGLSSQKIFFFHILDAVDTGSHAREKSELMETIVCSLEDVKSYISSGLPIDGMLVQALYLWKLSHLN